MSRLPGIPIIRWLLGPPGHEPDPRQILESRSNTPATEGLTYRKDQFVLFLLERKEQRVVVDGPGNRDAGKP